MMSRTFVRRSIGVALVAVALIGQSLAGFFTQELIAEAAILAILALSLDLLASAGLVSFGHAGLLGVGCYVFAGLTVLAGGNPNLAFPAAIVAGGLVAFLVGLFAVRTTGAFFIMVTLATAEMLYSWGFRSKTFDGADGMGGVPRLDLTAIGIDLNNPSTFALASILTLRGRLAAARTGHVLAVRPHARTPSGRIRPASPRSAAVSISTSSQPSRPPGRSLRSSGALKVQHINFISPDLVSWFVSGDVLIAVVIGGIGTLVGGPLGATLAGACSRSSCPRRSATGTCSSASSSPAWRC